MTNTQDEDESTDSPNSDLLAPFKKHPLVAVLVAVGAILSGVATFTDSVDKVWSFVSSHLIGPAEPEILSATEPGKFAWTKEQLLENWEFRIDTWDDERYSIALHVTLHYKNDAYNSLVYLKSVEEVFIQDSSGQRISPDVQKSLVEGQSKIDKTIILNFKKKPTNKDIFTLNTAKYYVDFTFGNIDWTKYVVDSVKKGSSDWYGGQVHLDIIVPDPTWPILRHVRLLKGEPSILELLVDNRSTNPLAISNVIIHAFHPRSNWDSCLSGDPLQQVVLAWPSRVEKQSQSNSWTEIANQKVEVETEFRFAGECSNYFFRAEVPVTHIIPENSISRIMLSLSELPKPNSVARPPAFLRHPFDQIHAIESLEAVPSSITEWSRFEVMIDPTNEIFPNILPAE